MSESSAHVCVIGAGPAGLAAAIALARVGCKVTTFDCAIPPIDKSCGEGLMPDSISALRQLGIELPPDLGFAFEGIRFCNGRSSVYARFPNGKGRGIRRTALHQLLVHHAEKEQVSLVWGAKHVELHDRGVLLNGKLMPADFVIGADGQNSRIGTQAALSRVVRENRAYGFRRHFRLTPWSPSVELHWGPDCQIYITPVAPQEVCVALISGDSGLRLSQALGFFPELRDRLATAIAVTGERGAMTRSRSLGRVATNRVALVGDASGSVHAITGQGMCLAFEQALALADALSRGCLHAYQLRHGQLMKRPQRMATLLETLAHHPALERRALAGLARRPELFESLVAIHVGASPLNRLCSWSLLDFSRAFLAA
jgi:2-polyprenyl-6-methoxyphenol hydroxylase-like FAD-dependent oxidoreductase